MNTEANQMETWHGILKFTVIVLAILASWPAELSFGQTAASVPSYALSLNSGPLETDKFKSVSRKRVAQSGDFLSADPSGWADLMPGDSFHGWTRVAIPPDKPLDPVSQWKLDKKHGTILCEGDRGHEWLRYDRELANFLLHVEWRFEKREGLKGYNSGVFVRNDAKGRVWFQAQVGDIVYIFGQTLIHGELSPIIKAPAPDVNPLHPIGEWNTYEIRCEGPNVTLWANDKLAGKFKAAEALKGYWGLEAEGFRIEFRNIKLKIIP
jgi:hypothetical protein